MQFFFSAAPLAISILAAIGVFWVHYRNQLERRHQEIVQNKDELCKRIRGALQLVSLTLNSLQAVRLLLRQLPDCVPSKFEIIEILPRIIADVESLQPPLNQLLTGINAMSPSEKNTTKVLLTLRETNSKFQTVEDALQAKQSQFDGVLKALQVAMPQLSNIPKPIIEAAVSDIQSKPNSPAISK